jgi:hypothetical protein
MYGIPYAIEKDFPEGDSGLSPYEIHRFAQEWGLNNTDN